MGIQNLVGNRHTRWADLKLFPLNHPVTRVSWFEAMAFCEWLNGSLDGASGIRLPSEAEWEWAARADTDQDYPFEGVFDPTKVNGRLSGLSGPTAVGLFQEGDLPFKLSDMSGNVYEWCADADSRDLPKAEISIPRRALRGGSWRSYPGFMMATARYYDFPENSTDYWGFRLVRDP